jgi:hypothetical protein
VVVVVLFELHLQELNGSLNSMLIDGWVGFASQLTGTAFSRVIFVQQQLLTQQQCIDGLNMLYATLI